MTSACPRSTPFARASGVSDDRVQLFLAAYPFVGLRLKVDHPTAATATTKQRPTNGSKPKVVAKTPTGRGCPDCGGDLEHVRWDNGGEKIACTNWRECRYRENVVPARAGEQS
jgi:hypothetical protein